MAFFSWKDVPDAILDQAVEEYIRRFGSASAKPTLSLNALYDWGLEDIEEARKMGIKL